MDSGLKDAVRVRYASVAARRAHKESDEEVALARTFGYSSGELDSIPEEANLGVSCGNPTAMASLRPGEVVVDLGSGGGLDVFLAAQKVGGSGRAIGIDMTPEMIALAERNLEKTALDNVEFHLADIEALPLESNSIDCVISNCVLNLVPDKAKAFAEIHRILKPGGRLAVSDIALRRTLPRELEPSVKRMTGCITGAIHIDAYRDMLEDAGFSSLEITDAGSDLNVYRELRAADVEEVSAASSSGCGASSEAPSEIDFDVNDYAASVKVLAIK